MDENRVNQLIQDALQRNATDNQYGVSKIPNHVHNGTDSSRIDYNNLVNIPSGAQTGTGADGALNITANPTTINLSNAAVVVKNYSALSITNTASLVFSNPATNGTIVFLLVQGNVTLTSSTSPLIDCSSMGAAGGASVDTTNVSSDGVTGSNGYGAVWQTNAGIKALGVSTSPGAGGAIGNLLTPYINNNLISYSYPSVYPGAGGGSGSNYIPVSGHGITGAGSRGGGGLVIVCGGAWNFTGVISVAGANGGNGTMTGVALGQSSGAGGGGGGAGGYFLGLYNSLIANTGSVTITGGTGGTGQESGGVNTQSGGGGGASGGTAGSAGTSSTGSGVKTGGDGAAGYSLIQAL